MYLKIMERSQNRYDTLYKLAENSEFLYNIYHKSDRGYKYLFEVKKCFLRFLSIFVKEAWNDGLTEDDIEMVTGEYILSNFESQVSDVVYKIKKNENEIYFVLLELQSKNNKMMSYRMLEYMLEIWRKFTKNNNSNKNLPLIIPCVLYTGKSRWTSSRNFNKLVENYKLYKKIIPSFEYILIDVNQYTDEELLEFCGIVGNAMYIGKGRNIKELKERLEILLSKIGRLAQDEQEIFFNWVSHLIVKNADEMNELSEKIIKRKDDETMLADLMMQLREEMEEEARKKGMERGLQEGREKGLQEGREKGLQEGMKKGMEKGMEKGRRKILKKILINKFGELQDEIDEKIDNMNAEELDILEKNIFEIQSLSEV